MFLTINFFHESNDRKTENKPHFTDLLSGDKENNKIQFVHLYPVFYFQGIYGMKLASNTASKIVLNHYFKPLRLMDG